MNELIAELLNSQGIEPILIDVGASGGTPRIWQPIRSFSTYIGFDGDTREIRHAQEAEFRHAAFVHEIISAGDSPEVTFYLTRSPYCSSTLRPNPLVTDNFLSADSFIIERTETVKASSLSSAIERLDLPHIDWMKIDTQGTDLRIYDSLRPDLRNKLLAMDIEPGLRGAYVGEDLFCDVHKRLMNEGFWLSNLKVCGLVRMRKSTLDVLAANDPSISGDALSKSIRQTPGWTEARYLRSLESMAQINADRRDYVLLYVFAAMDRQFGFCMDLALEYRKKFGSDALSARLESEALALIKQSIQTASTPKNHVQVTLFGRVKRKIKRVLSNGHQVV